MRGKADGKGRRGGASERGFSTFIAGCVGDKPSSAPSIGPTSRETPPLEARFSFGTCCAPLSISARSIYWRSCCHSACLFFMPPLLTNRMQAFYTGN